jgi:hypothetical protein
MEEYFNNKLEEYELSGYYKNNFDIVVKTPPPAFQADLLEKYRTQGQFFFDSFSFNKEDYDVLLVEEAINFDLNFSPMVAKPDLVLREKSTGKIILYDYKTALPFWTKNGKEVSDKKKIDSYYNQMYLYTYALREQKNIAADEICLWFIRGAKKVIRVWNKDEETAAVDRIDKLIGQIMAEEEFPYNNSSEFFCQNLCGCRKSCEYW